MSGLHARVANGRLVLDEPTNLPEGTIIDLVFDDEGDNLTDAERKVLHAKMARSWEAAKAGNVRDANEVIAKLRKRE